MSSKTNPKFKQIDDALAEYFHRQDVPNYHDENGIGLFLNYIKAEELDDAEIPIEHELGDNSDPTDCQYLYMCINGSFPIPLYAEIPSNQKDAYMHCILQYCYKHNQPPLDQHIQEIIIPKCNGTINRALLPKKELDDPEIYPDIYWNEVVYALKQNNIQIDYFHDFITECTQQQTSIYDYNYHKLREFINKFAATHDQKTKICEAFHSAVQSVAAKIRRNHTNIVDGYEKKHDLVEKILGNLKTMRGIEKNNDGFKDEELVILFMRMDINDILYINDMILRLKCACFNDGICNIFDNKHAKKILNDYIHCNFRYVSYNDKKLKLDPAKYFEICTLIAKRLLRTADYFDKLICMDRKEYECDEEKKEDECGIKYDLGAVQRYIYLFLIEFLNSALKCKRNYSA
eukprot:156178_1